MRPLLCLLLLASCGGQVEDETTTDSGTTQDSGTTEDSGTADSGSSDAEAPAFPGLAVLVAQSTSAIGVHWLEAKDNVTDAADITYELYTGVDVAAATASFEGGSTPVATVTGQTRHELTGLSAGQERAILVVARDEAGLASTPSVRVARSLTADLSVTATPIDLDALGTAITAHGLNDYSISGAGSDVNPGDILILPNDYGRWLLEVVDVTAESGGSRIQTQHARMGDFIGGGELYTTFAAPSPASGTGVVIEGRAGGVPSRSSSWTSDDGQISVDETRWLAGPPGADMHAAEGEILEAFYTYGWRAEIDPSLSLNPDWDTDNIHAVIGGVFTFDGSVGYLYESNAERVFKHDLLERNVTLRYVVAGVPVIQDVSLKIGMELALSAQASFGADVVLHAEKDLQLILDYDGENWTFGGTNGYEQTVDVVVDGKVTAGATAKIIVELGTSFYKAAEAKVTVTPTLDLQAEARFIPTPVQMTKFDVNFYVDAKASASLSVLGIKLGSWESTNVQLYNLPIHSLPELRLPDTLTMSTCRPMRLYLGISDGYNNAVQGSTIDWEIIDGPGTGSLNVVAPTARNVAEFTATAPGTWTVRVSGYGDGFLGALGTQYIDTVITAEDPVDVCDTTLPAVDPGPVHGCKLPSGTTNEWGVTGTPTLSDTVVGLGDTLDLDVELACGPSCYAFASVEPMFTGGLGGAYSMCFIGSEVFNTCDLTQVSAGPSHASVYIDQAVVDNPGRYTVWLQMSKRTGGGGHSVDYSDLWDEGWTSSASDVLPDNTSESCEGPAGFPGLYFEVVGLSDGDNNDTPAESLDVDINGESVSSTYRASSTEGNRDTDWFDIHATSEPAYDSPGSFSPACEFAVCVHDDEFPGLFRPVTLYGSRADAEAGGPVVATSATGCVAAQGTEGQHFFAMTDRDAVFRGSPKPYTIEATSTCDTGMFDGIQRVTGPMPTSSTTISPGSTVTVDIPITSGVSQASVSALDLADYDFLDGQGWIRNLDGLSTFSATLTARSDQPPGDYPVEVTLTYAAGSSAYSRYLHDPEFSQTHYKVVSTIVDSAGNYVSEMTWLSDVPLVIITVTG